ncbi:unnamed protein product [Nippostrongylus brasiliensis]|uniref:SLC12 domain-containing protein n=1 Tax=Nippostrongylus brasiliensis TaxID=27835 RepID=A0A0N4XU91_NIPBR|nr:unnamed protein product [Nippostrongylus brasiliensis]
MMVPNSLENILKWLPEGSKGEAYTSGSTPTPEDSSDVVLLIGKEFAKEEENMGVLRPWMERLRNRDVQLMVVIAPREHNVEQNIAAWNKVAVLGNSEEFHVIDDQLQMDWSCCTEGRMGQPHSMPRQ